MCFYHFYFFNKVSNFRNRILTSQKHELVVSNCQWNCMFIVLPKTFDTVRYRILPGKVFLHSFKNKNLNLFKIVYNIPTKK